MYRDDSGSYFILLVYFYGLGVVVERLVIFVNVIVFCIGKSIYVRVGIIVNLILGEVGWCGYFILEFFNFFSVDCCIYVNEGIV